MGLTDLETQIKNDIEAKGHYDTNSGSDDDKDKLLTHTAPLNSS